MNQSVPQTFAATPVYILFSNHKNIALGEPQEIIFHFPKQKRKKKNSQLSS